MIQQNKYFISQYFYVIQIVNEGFACNLKQNFIYRESERNNQSISRNLGQLIQNILYQMSDRTSQPYQQKIFLSSPNSKLNIHEDSTPTFQEKQNKEQQQQEIDHYADDTPLPKAKPFDLKALWLGQTNQILQKYNTKLKQVKEERRNLQQGLRIFEQNEKRYKLSSLRKIQIKIDKKTLLNEYKLKTRQTIQKINPALIINILSYVDEHLFLTLSKIRKVSKIFNEIYLNQSIQFYMAEKDYLYSGATNPIKQSVSYCKKYVKFHKTFLYYKAMQYCEQIPQNSIMKDFEQAVNFINQIHKLVLEKQNRNFTYYELMNNFMKKHRVVIGLSSLSLTSLVLVRKAAIIAFSNYLAFNQLQRTKQEITKTKYHKVINVVEYEDYRDSLIVNTKVSNYLWENFNQNFAVLVTNSMGVFQPVLKVKTWNILIYHLHNDQKACYLQDYELIQNKFNSARLDIQFSQNMQTCKFSTIEYLNWIKMQGTGKYMDIITSPINKMYQTQFQKQEQLNQQVQQFSYCYFYRFQQYYLIAIPNQFL